MKKRSAVLSASGLLPPQAQSTAFRARSMGDVVLAYSVYEFVLACVVGSVANFSYSYFALSWAQPWSDTILPSSVAAIGIVSGSVIRDHYDGYERRSQASVIWSGLIASLRGFAFLLALLFLFKTSETLSRGALVVQFLAVTTAVMFSRASFYMWVRHLIAAGRIATRRVLILGDNTRIVDMITRLKFCERLQDAGNVVVRIVSWQAQGSQAQGSAMVDRNFIANAIADCRENDIDCVVIIPSAARLSLAENLIASLSETPVTVHVLPFAGLAEATTTGAGIGGQASILVTHSPLGKFSKIGKRGLDIATASAMLILLSPLLICVGIAIKLDSPGPIFFRQTRHGYGNRLIRVFKFRSMRVTEDGAAFRQATRNDTRITAVGRFIRRSNVDELPQLINVLLGDMSLVGPRPHPVALNNDFAERIRLFHRRHNILPGITGWAQVNGHRGETDTEDKMLKRVEHDLWYIDNWSLGLDLRILILTLFSSVAYRNAG